MFKKQTVFTIFETIKTELHIREYSMRISANINNFKTTIQ